VTTHSLYTLDELLRAGNEGIIIRTADGTEISIRQHGDKTIIWFPFGNKLEPIETVGILGTGFVAIERPRESKEGAP
jgi:hypothetical protein